VIKWDALDKPKECGSLGFLETRAMNTALLGKWIHGLESGDQSLCIELLRKEIPERQEFLPTQV
jgi:hypothetical protein